MRALRDWNLSEASNYLRSRNLTLEEVKEITSAGEGNMNCTLRFSCESHSFIVKQSSPYCEKYPSVAAPVERIQEEEKFYRLASQSEGLNSKLPKILDFNKTENLLVMEDLGQANDFAYVYSTDETIGSEELSLVGEILNQIHQAEIEEEVFINRAMRLLNHEHIYDIPLRRNNGLDLNSITEGLQNTANSLIGDEIYKRRVAELGGLYLYQGNILLHGDYYPNSWIKTDRGLFVIDPEFGFIGLGEFDLGVACGHLYLSNHSEEQVAHFLSSYSGNYDKTLIDAFAGVEIMRRLIGVAQLPVSYGIERKTELLERSKSLVLGS